MKRNGTQDKIDIALLKQSLDVIKSNDLVHLAADIKELKEDNQVDHKEFTDNIARVEEKVDKISNKIAYWSGGMAVVIIIVEWILSIRK